MLAILSEQMSGAVSGHALVYIYILGNDLVDIFNQVANPSI